VARGIIHASQTLLKQYLEKYWDRFSEPTPLMHIGIETNASEFGVKKFRIS